MGESGLLPICPRVATDFIPETNQMKHDALELNSAIVIDARLRPTHTTNVLQSVLIATCKSDYPYPLTHMSSHQYFLLLSFSSDPNHFLLEFAEPL